MSPVEIIVIACAACFVVGVAVWAFLRKKKGKGCIGCDCSSCAGCGKKKQEK